MISDRLRVHLIGSYLLEARVLRPSDEKFLLNVVPKARRRADFRLSTGQAIWFENIVDNYDVDETGDHLLGVAFVAEIAAS